MSERLKWVVVVVREGGDAVSAYGPFDTPSQIANLERLRRRPGEPDGYQVREVLVEPPEKMVDALDEIIRQERWEKSDDEDDE